MKKSMLLIIFGCFSFNVLCATENRALQERPNRDLAKRPKTSVMEKPTYDAAKTERLKKLLKKDYKKNHVKILSLIKQRADPNAITDDVNESALHKACKEDDLRVVRSALAHRADPNSNAGCFKSTPLMLTLSEPVAQYLLDHNADIHKLNIYGSNVLHYAAGQTGRSFQLLALLCNLGAHANQKDDEGNAPLHKLLLYESIESDPNTAQKVAVLLLAGSDPHLKNNRGATPLDYLEHPRHKKLLSSMQALVAVTPRVKLERETTYESLLNVHLPTHLLLPLNMLTRLYLCGTKPVGFYLKNIWLNKRLKAPLIQGLLVFYNHRLTLDCFYRQGFSGFNQFYNDN